MPGDDGVEAVVERRVGIDTVQADAMAELAYPGKCGDAAARVEVVKVAPRHQEVRRADVAFGLELRHGDGGGERHVDVVTQQ